MPSDRRQFLRRSGLVGLGLTAGVAGHAALADESTAAGPESEIVPAAAAPGPRLGDRHAFDGEHQAGILTAQPDHVSYFALDAIAPGRTELIDALRALSVQARSLTQGTTIAVQEPDAPPSDSGTLGPTIAPDALTVTIAFGASLFDHRYGLAGRRPSGLVTMPRFPDDDLDPDRSHGDLLVQIAANRRDTVVHAVRELMKVIRGGFALRWMLDGFQGAGRSPSPHGSKRNLFGFRDGTGNPDVADPAAMRRLVWVPPATGEPAWTAGGTYQVVRTIRMYVEFWDRVGLREQENMIGRRRDTGAPLGGTGERQDPRLDTDPTGKRIPLDAHIRLANPRTAATDDQRILRRGYSYQRGFDPAGDLDQGLLFVAFNQDVERQFATIQRRLAGEPMVDYIVPVGGGYFFAPRGASGPTDWVGSGLFAA